MHRLSGGLNEVGSQFPRGHRAPATGSAERKATRSLGPADPCGAGRKGRSMSALEVYRRQGWRIVGVPHGIKGSRDPGWPDLEPSMQEIEQQLKRGGNV